MKVRPNTIEEVLTPDFAAAIIHMITRRTGRPVFDEDLIQDALLRGVLAQRRMCSIRHPRAFFAKVIRDTVVDKWRRRKAETEICEDRFYKRPTIEEDLDRKRQLERIGNALSALAERDRAIVKMFYLEEVAIPDIAAQLSVSASAIKMTLLRSRHRLRQLLDIQSV